MKLSRRDFFKAVGVLGTSLGLGVKTVAAEPDPVEEVVNEALALFPHEPGQPLSSWSSSNWVGLHVGERVEVSGAGYARQQTDLDQGSVVVFPDADESWGLVTHMAVYDGMGNLLYTQELDTPKHILYGDTPVVELD